jgi:hypothetical protein
MDVITTRHERDWYLIANEQDKTEQNGTKNEISWTILFFKIALKHSS